MRTTIDIPDDTYRALKIRAAQQGRSVRDIVLRSVQQALEAPEAASANEPFRIPVIPSTQPGTLNLTNEQIEEILASDLISSS